MRTISLLTQTLYKDPIFVNSNGTFYVGEWNFDNFGNKTPFLDTTKADPVSDQCIEQLTGYKIIEIDGGYRFVKQQRNTN